jgi:hypothetical protein
VAVESKRASVLVLPSLGFVVRDRRRGSPLELRHAASLSEWTTWDLSLHDPTGALVEEDPAFQKPRDERGLL